jgi:hypothetical protein
MRQMRGHASVDHVIERQTQGILQFMKPAQRKRWLVPALLVVCVLLAFAVSRCALQPSGTVRPISPNILYPSETVRVAWTSLFGGDDADTSACPEYVRWIPAAESEPIPHVPTPDHPFMASGGVSNMHCDASMSDTYTAAGPLDNEMQIISRTEGFGGYGTLAHDRLGRIVAVFSNGRRFRLDLIDDQTLELLATHALPSRPWYWWLQGIMPWQYIGAGMYFYLDHEDRAVVPTTKNTIEVIQVSQDDGSFQVVRTYDLQTSVVPMRWPKRDSIAWVLPDWSGRYYWFASTEGMVGTVEIASGDIRTLHLEGEIIENSFAVGQDGVFIVSDHAMYRFRSGDEGQVIIDWRTPYDRGPAKKPGHIARGSGTSVSLMGDLDGLVAITDNAEPRIHLLLLRRHDGEIVCRHPLFQKEKSGTDVSVACFEHADPQGVGLGRYSLLVENNWGHHRFPRSRPEPGLTRVDALREADGTYSCREVWSSSEKSLCVFKLSLGNGLVYMYWQSEECSVTHWYWIAIDFHTGETAYRRLAGRGLGFNNWAGAVFLHPRGGIAYSTTIFGLVMLREASLPLRGSQTDAMPCIYGEVQSMGRAQ